MRRFELLERRQLFGFGVGLLGERIRVERRCKLRGFGQRFRFERRG